MVRKMIIAVAVAAGFLGIQSPAWAGLRFKNNTSETITIAVTHMKDGVLVSDGWFEIKPGRTLDYVTGDLHHRYYYFYAYSKRDEWNGNHEFWIHPTNNFEIAHVREIKLPKGAQKVGFKRIDTGDSRNHTVNLLAPGASIID